MDEEREPLEEWAARRDRRRPAPGERKAAPLGDRPERGAHVDPGAPRAVQEWDGRQWTPAGVAEDFPAAAAETGEHAGDRAGRVPLPPSGRLPPMPEPWRPTEPFHRPEPPRA